MTAIIILLLNIRNLDYNEASVPQPLIKATCNHAQEPLLLIICIATENQGFCTISNQIFLSNTIFANG